MHPSQLMKQITIIDLIFQVSLRKQANKFSEGIVPQFKGIEVPVSTLLVICFEWVRANVIFDVRVTQLIGF